MKRYLVIDYNDSQRHFVDSEEEVKRHIEKAFKECKFDPEEVYQRYEFLDLHNEKSVGFRFHFEIDHNAFDDATGNNPPEFYD
jgi:hypothetical protein